MDIEEPQTQHASITLYNAFGNLNEINFTPAATNVLRNGNQTYRILILLLPKVVNSKIHGRLVLSSTTIKGDISCKTVRVFHRTLASSSKTLALASFSFE